MAHTITIMIGTIIMVDQINLLLSMSEKKMTRKKKLNPKAYASIAGKLNKNLTVEREHFNLEKWMRKINKSLKTYKIIEYHNTA